MIFSNYLFLYLLFIICNYVYSYSTLNKISTIPSISSNSYSSSLFSSLQFNPRDADDVCTDPLVCYINSLELVIPDSCFDIDGTDLCISNFVCKNFSIYSIPSAYKPPVSIEISVDNIEGYCQGNYKYGKLYKGVLTAELIELDLDLEIIVKKNETDSSLSYTSSIIDEALTLSATNALKSSISNNLPEEFNYNDDYPYDYSMFPIFTNFTTCDFPTFNLVLTFSNPGLDALSGVIENIIKGLINEAICVKGNEFLEVNVTTLIVEEIDPALYNITLATADPYPEYDSHYLNWSESIVSTIHNLVDSLKGFTGLTEFVKCMRSEEPSDIFSSVNKYFEFFSTSSSLFSQFLSSSSSSTFLNFVSIFDSYGFSTSQLKSFFTSSYTSTALFNTFNIVTSRILSKEVLLDSLLKPLVEDKLLEKFEATLLRGSPIPLTPYFSSNKASPFSSLLTSYLLADENSNSTLFSGLNLEFENVSFSGVETLNNLQLFEPLTDISNVTLRTALDMDYLTVEILLKLSYNESNVIESDDDHTLHDDDDYIESLKSSYKQKAISRSRSLQEDIPTSIPTSIPTVEPPAYYEEFIKISLGVENLKMILDTSIIVDQYLLNSLYLDQLGQSPGCWIKILKSLTIPNFDMNFKITTYKIEQLLPTGQVEEDIVQLLNNVLQFIFDEQGYGELTDIVVTKFFQGPFRTQFNERMAAELVELSKEYPCETHYPYDDAVELIVWEESDLIHTIDTLLNEKFGAEGLNNLFNCATNGTGSIGFPLGDKREVEIFGLNSFYEFEILKPYNSTEDEDFLPYNLKNSIGLGYCPDKNNTEECNPLTLSIHPTTSPTLAVLSPAQSFLSSYFSMDIDSYYVSLLTYLLDLFISSTTPSNSTFFVATTINDIRSRLGSSIANSLLSTSEPAPAYLNYLPSFLNPFLYSSAELESNSLTGLDIYLENFTFFLEILFQVDKDTLRDLQFNQVGVKGCMASSIQNFTILDLNLNVTDAVLTYSTEKSRDITVGLSKLFSFLTKQSSIDSHNSKINSTLALSGPTCEAGGVVPFSNDDDESGAGDSTDWKWQLVILIIACLGSLVGLVMAYNYWGHANRFDKEADNHLVFEDKNWFKKYGFKNSLLFHKDIPLAIRIATPIAILANIALFMASNMIERAVSVLVTMDVGDSSIDLGNVFDFGLANTVTDMWSAGVYPLAILIAFFSGAWPYCKMLSMLSAWILPPKILTIENREHVLIVLDILGKWSLIDFFVMVLMLCAFYFNLIIIPGVFVVHVTVRPYFPFYSFLLATMISLGLGHTMLACHRLVSEKKVIEVPDFFDPKLTITDINYEIYIDDLDVLKKLEEEQQAKAQLELENLKEQQDAKEEKEDDEIVPQYAPAPPVTSYIRKVLVVRLTKKAQLFFVLLFLITGLFVVLGTVLYTMGFEMKGLVGLMLKDENLNDYSFISIGNSIPKHSGIPNNFAVRWMQACYFLFGVGMPLSYVATSILLWLTPLTLSKQRLFFVLSEVFNAWSAVDVFCISIAAALLEIQQFVDFIIGDSCDGINVILAEYLDPLLGGDDVCFDVIAYLNNNSWTVFLAACLQLCVSIPSLYIINYGIKSRLEQSTRDADDTSYGFKDKEIVGKEGDSPIHNPLIDEDENNDAKIPARDVNVRTISVVSDSIENVTDSITVDEENKKEEDQSNIERIHLRTLSTNGYVENPSKSLRFRVNFLLFMQKIGFLTFVRVTNIEEVIDINRLTSTSRSIQREGQDNSGNESATTTEDIVTY